MIQDIFPHIYHNEYTPRPVREVDRLVVICEKGTLCRKEESGAVTLPLCGARQGQYLFSIDETAYYLWEGETLAEEDGYAYMTTQALRECLPDETLFACVAAGSLHRWYGQNRYCGRCAGEMKKSTAERAMVCPQCGQTVYPKICPAVIVAVTDGDRLLLTRYVGRAAGRYALVAGFNEIGESIEDTVRREVLEETGLRVKNLRFYRSQPWVFTDSLLMGFFCDLDGSNQVHRQESELAEAGWHHRDTLPADKSHISLTAEMIDLFRQGKEPT